MRDVTQKAKSIWDISASGNLTPFYQEKSSDDTKCVYQESSCGVCQKSNSDSLDKSVNLLAYCN